jgi:hypothetical protein
MLRLDAFELLQDEDGRLRDYQSRVTWLEDGTEIGRGAAVPGRPLRLHGLVARQVGFAPVVKMRGRDSSGRPLALQIGGDDPEGSGEIAVTFPRPSAQQLILIPDYERFLVLSFEPLSAEGKPSLYVDLLGENGVERQRLAVLRESGTLETSDIRLETELAYRPILRVERRPGLSLLVGGAALAAMALAVAWLAPPQLLWIALGAYEEKGTQVHVLAPPAARGSRWPRRLLSDLQGAFDGDA